MKQSVAFRDKIKIFYTYHYFIHKGLFKLTFVGSYSVLVN